jgi:hypothetical protein
MAAHFNPIALRLPLSRELKTELDRLAVRWIALVVSCPECDAKYKVIAPASISDDELQEYRAGLRDSMAVTCGSHPPVVQIQ